jgi:uncharacterized protein YbaP (TraB family)
MQISQTIIVLLCLKHNFFQVARCLQPTNGEIKCTESEDQRHDDKIKSFLWKIDGDPASYLFGTIHVPYLEVWDKINDAVLKQFNSSDKLYVEIDKNIPRVQSYLASCVLLPKGQTVSDILPNDVYIRLKAYLDYLKDKISTWISRKQLSKGLSADNIFRSLFGNWEQREIIWTLTQTLGLVEKYIKSIEYSTMDEHLYNLAKKQAKPIGDIENVEDVCNVFNNIDRDPLLYFTKKILELQQDAILDISTIYRENMISEYINGTLSSSTLYQDTGYFTQYVEDTRKVPYDSVSFDNEKKQTQYLQSLTTYLKNHLFRERNKKMADKIMEILKTDSETSFFFAFGAGHFIGEHSIVDILKNAGFKIKRYSEENLNQVKDQKMACNRSTNAGNVIILNVLFVCLIFQQMFSISA